MYGMVRYESAFLSDDKSTTEPVPIYSWDVVNITWQSHSVFIFLVKNYRRFNTVTPIRTHEIYIRQYL